MPKQTYKIEEVALKVLALRRSLNDFLNRYAERLAGGWRARVVRRKGWLADAIDFRETIARLDFRQIVIDTDKDPRVTYSDIYERGRRDGAKYTGRFPLALALEEEDLRIERDIDLAVSGAFR